MGLRILSVLLVSAASAVTLPGAPVVDIINSLTIASYRNYLDNYLYTHDGNNRGIGGAEHDPARTSIYNELALFGLSPILQSFSYNSNTYYNVVAQKTGTTPGGGVLVVGAHYDSTGTPGADDDASGVAGVLAIAKALAPYSFANTIVFGLFDREEQGLYGSTAYVQGLGLGAPVVGMVQLDMIAYGSTAAARIYAGATTAAWDLGLAQSLQLWGGVTPAFSGVLNRSDHAPFLTAGYPAALVIEQDWASNPCYHTACDSVDTASYINYGLGTNISRGVAAYLAEQADVPEPGTWLIVLSGVALVAVLRRSTV
jgi:hypothetical protein